jgi:hypothetical protein
MGKARTRGSDETRFNHLNRLINTKIPELPTATADLMRTVVASVEYDDPVLIKSSLAAIRDHLVTLVTQVIDSRVKVAESIEEDVRQLLAEFDGVIFAPDERTDEIARHVEDQLDVVLADLAELWKGTVQPFQASGADVRNADRLIDAISRLGTLKTRVLGGWVRSTGPFPQVDRDMVRRSRESVARGGYEDIDDVIRRLESESN